MNYESSWAAVNRPLVTTALLGNAIVPNAPFEQPNGDPYIIAMDFLQQARNGGNPAVGPFEYTGSGQIFHVLNASVENSTPVIAAESQHVTVGENYSFNIPVIDHEGDSLVFSEVSTPSWLSFNAGSGVLSGTPITSDIGSYTVTLNVSDGNTNEDYDISVYVSAAGNDAPAFTSVPVTAATEAQEYKYAVSAIDVDGDSITITSLTLPAWMSFNAVTNTLSGTPLPTDAGMHAVSLSVSDGTVAVQQNFNVMVFATPAGTNNVRNGDLEEGYASLVTNWQPTGSTTYSTVSSNSGNGSIVLSSGGSRAQQSVPTVPGVTYDISVWVDARQVITGNCVFDTGDEYDGAGQGQYVIKNANSGWQQFSGSFTATDEEVILRIFTTSAFTGTIYFDDIVVTPNTMTAANQAPEITSVPLTAVDQGNLYSYSVSTADVEGDSLTVTATNSPAWLSLNSSILSGTPSALDVGMHSVTLRVSDGSLYTEQSFVVNVGTAGNDAPFITSIPVTGVIVDEAYSYTLASLDVDGDSVNYSVDTIPAWLSFDAGTGILSGTPSSSDLGMNAVCLLLDDGAVVVEHGFNIMVFTAPVASNYVPNGSFEDGGVTPTSWVLTGAEGSTENVHSGFYSLKKVDGTRATQLVQLQPNTDYDISVWINTVGLTGGKAIFDTADKFDGAGQGQFVISSSNGGWTQYSGSFNSGAETEMTIRLFGNDMLGVAYYDDVVLVPSGVPVGNQAPVITSHEVTDAQEGSNYSYRITAADVEGDSLFYTAVTLPSWLTYDDNTKTISGIPSAANVGADTVTVQVSDGEYTDVQTFTVTVSSASTPEQVWLDGYGISDMSADDDGDGIINLIEFALDSNPVGVDAEDRVMTFTPNGGNMDFKFHRGQASVTYVIEKSTNLSTWTEHLTITDDTYGSVGSDCVVPVSLSEMQNEKLFIRLKVEQ